MAQLLRQVVAAPRVRHEDTGLDLCYVTENIIATSGPSQTYPKRAYRTPLDRLVKFLDEKHGDNWAIWEFRAEGTGYPDDAVYGRIHHFPWPDHHPPPFRLVPLIMGTMRNWLQAGESGKKSDGKASSVSNPDSADKITTVNNSSPANAKATPRDVGNGGSSATGGQGVVEGERVVVVHCKAGKGRSGSMSVAYLISECGWTKSDAMQRFTERRMVPGFGSGVSIPSQIRWVDYAERWAASHGGGGGSNKKKKKRYVDRAVEVLEVHCWGLRDGVKVEIEGFVEEGKKIKVFHAFERNERQIVHGGAPGSGGKVRMLRDMLGDDGNSGTDVGEEETNTEGSNTPRRNDNGISGTGDGGGGGGGGGGSVGKLLRKGKIVAKAISRLSKGPSTLNNQTRTVPTEEGDTGTETPKSTKSISSATSGSGTGTGSGIGQPPTPQPKKNKKKKKNITTSRKDNTSSKDKETPGGQAVLFKPSKPVVLPTSDVNISLERKSRTTAAPSSLSVTTAIAHFWFNVFFEGDGPERMSARSNNVATTATESMRAGEEGVAGGQEERTEEGGEEEEEEEGGESIGQQQQPLESGVFGIDWDAMDGLKGSKRKGVRAVDRIEVVWRLVPEKGKKVVGGDDGGVREDVAGGAGGGGGVVEEVREPEVGEEVMEPEAADWRGKNAGDVDPEAGKRLGMQRKKGKEEDEDEVGRDGDGDGDVRREMDGQGMGMGIGPGNGKGKGKGKEGREESGLMEDVVDTDEEMDELKMVKSAGPKGEKI